MDIWPIIFALTYLIMMKPQCNHHAPKHLLFIIIWIIFFWWWTLTTTDSYSKTLRNTDISINITNTYSWQIARSTDQNIINSGWNYWTSLSNPMITISMSDWWSFTIIWSLEEILSWSSPTSFDNLKQIITLDAWDGQKMIQSLFMKDGWEPYTSDPIGIVLDQTPPSDPIILWPDENILLTGKVRLIWQSVTDRGIWFSHYKVHISLSPSFSTENNIVTWDNSLEFVEDILPKGTIFRYVEAYDLLGNKSRTDPAFFHYKIPSQTSWWFWGWSSEYISSSTSRATEDITPGNSWHDSVKPDKNDNTSVKSNETITGNDLISKTETIAKPSKKVHIYKKVNKKIENRSWDWSLKDWLLSWYHNSAEENRQDMIIPDQSLSWNNNIYDINPSEYRNLINNYRLWINPLWYSLNYISRLLFPLYYLSMTLRYIFTKLTFMTRRKNRLS